MFKKYGENTQKGKVIRIMLRKGSKKFYEDFEVEHYRDLFVGNNAGPRLSQLVKDGVVEVEYFENPKTFKTFFGNKEVHCFHRAKYKLTNKAVRFYKDLYNEGTFFEKLFN